MHDGSYHFSKKQWDFLAVFDAIGEPVPLDVVGAVAPLLPHQLIDVMEQAEKHKILVKTANGIYGLSRNLPPEMVASFNRINTESHLIKLLDRLDRLNLIKHLSPESYAGMLFRSGSKKGGQLEINLAEKFLEAQQHEKALWFYEIGLNGLASRLSQAKSARLFVHNALLFSDLSFSLGREFVTAYRFLEIAGPVSERLGDQRAKTLIDLHIGRLFYIGNRRSEAVALMEKAEAAADSLGDEDIRIRAAEFLALYYYMQGRFPEAMVHFETGFRSFEANKGSHIANPSAPIFYGYCAAYLGQFHKAVGNLDSAWRRAKQEKNESYAAVIRAALGMILLLTKKEKEASIHIKNALVEAKTHKNMLGWYFAQGYMAFLFYLKGDYKKAHLLIKEVSEKGKQYNIVHQISSPWLLEMVFDLRTQGYSIFTEKEYLEIYTRLLLDPSTHLRGVLLRLITQQMGTASGNSRQLRQYIAITKKALPDKGLTHLDINKSKAILLVKSEALLKPTGDPVQLAKTRIELARLALQSGNRKEAASLAGKARKGLSGVWEDFFPDGIRALLDEYATPPAYGETQVIDGEQLLHAMTDLAPSLGMSDFFHRMVSTMNRLFRAEKGGLFWAEDHRANSLLLRAGRNLNLSDTTAPEFSHNMTAIRQCLKSGKPKILRSRHSVRKLKHYNVFSLLCIPVKQNHKISGVLYFDNSYLDGCFDFLDESVLEKISGLLNLYIDRVRKIEALVTDATVPPPGTSTSGATHHQHHFLADSKAMTRLLESTEQIAASDSTVLIQGETGVGKELMAERVHRLSPRRNKPFIIIDPTTIPDSLVESELFGYEKGAFTGADRQKRGRIELAHQGTLFIDEIGDMPKSIQAKLLRVLQEKSFVRIGGSQPIHSDFRLIAATNRKLADEVAEGNFREDLFYRISIVPIQIPPLRERKEDIGLLARHFLTFYSQKYNRQRISLSREDELALVNYYWPGNVRELINVVERAVILSQGDHLELNLEPSSSMDTSPDPFADTPTMDELQRRYIEFILQKTNGRVSGKGGAAQLLDMKRSTLYSRMDKLGIDR